MPERLNSQTQDLMPQGLIDIFLLHFFSDKIMVHSRGRTSLGQEIDGIFGISMLEDYLWNILTIREKKKEKLHFSTQIMTSSAS